ncbi:GGDEF domain-containing protein [Thalassotalea fusca]
MNVQTRIIILSSAVMVMVIISSLVAVKFYLEDVLDQRFEHRLATVSQLALTASSYLNAKQQPDYVKQLDELADKIAKQHNMRVSFISNYGIVYADSAFNEQDTTQLDNHGTRPEVAEAKKNKTSIARRYSDSLQQSMIYVASYSPEQQLFARLAIHDRTKDSLFENMRSMILIIIGMSALAIVVIFIVANRISNVYSEQQRAQQNKQLIEHTRQHTLCQTLISMLNSAVTFDDANKVFYSIMPKLLPQLCGAVVMQVEEGEAEVNLVKWGKDWPEDVVVLNSSLKESSRDVVHSRDNRLISVRLSFQEKQLGWLQLYNPEESHQETLLHMVVELAKQISMALHNLQLKCKLRDQAIRDPLTDLYNRRFMYESFEQSLNRAERHQTHLAVLMLDLDHFKRFNDNYGHEVGDEILKSVAELLRSNIRLEDIACRYGGEEFCIVCPDTNLPDAYKLAEKLRIRVARLDIVNQEACHEQVTISIGAAIYPNHGNNMKDLIALADKAMYRAKEKGRDCTIVADPDISINQTL